MSGTSWALWAGLCAIAAAASIWHYRRRETAGHGRMLLAGLRAAALALLLLILFDPQLPGAGSAAAGS
jgi:LPXTG-motif cell wall-anchored protein